MGWLWFRALARFGGCFTVDLAIALDDMQLRAVGRTKT
jgi:hypothetical protein